MLTIDGTQIRTFEDLQAYMRELRATMTPEELEAWRMARIAAYHARVDARYPGWRNVSEPEWRTSGTHAHLRELGWSKE